MAHIMQIESLECNKPWAIKLMGKVFPITGRKDMIQLLRIQDRLVKRLGIKKFKKLREKLDNG